MESREVNVRWRVGEVAKATGLTVRALHHYDSLGLASPSGRTEAGHRLYQARDLAALYQVLALRQLGLPLAQIRGVMRSGGDDLAEVIAQHLRGIDERIRALQRLRSSLATAVSSVEEGEVIDGRRLLDLMEMVVMQDQYFTPEQAEAIEERRQALGDEGMARAQKDWATLIAAAGSLRTAGVAPTDPRALAVAERWREMIAQFTGGDAGIGQGLRQMYQDKGPEVASRGMVDAELMAWVGEALRAGGSET